MHQPYLTAREASYFDWRPPDPDDWAHLCWLLLVAGLTFLAGNLIVAVYGPGGILIVLLLLVVAAGVTLDPHR